MAERASVEIIRPGMLSTCQDAGRTGWAHLAVPPSGAADLPSWHMANQMAGNVMGACAIETTLTGISLKVTRLVVVVVGGAPCRVTIDGASAPWGQPIRLQPGALLDVGPAESGVRSYVAFSGGLYPKTSLGSHSTCLLSGLGPASLKAGDRIPLGPSPAKLPLETHWPVPWPGISDDLVLTLYLGPRSNWLSPSSRQTLNHAKWIVTDHSNRVGLRLQGPELESSNPDPAHPDRELPSEGIVKGSLQLPGDGQPVLFGPDHPTTGGYPVIGVVDSIGIAAAAQSRPGSTIRFAPIEKPLWSD